MNEIIKEALDQLRALEWDEPVQASVGNALGVFVNPFQSAAAQEINTRLRLICRTLIAAIGDQEIKNETIMSEVNETKCTNRALAAEAGRVAKIADTVTERLAQLAEKTADVADTFDERISSVADFAHTAAHSAEGRLDHMGESLKAMCPGCNHPVYVVHMKAKCMNCGSEGHLIWTWKAQDGAILPTEGNHYHNLGDKT